MRVISLSPVCAERRISLNLSSSSSSFPASDSAAWDSASDSRWMGCWEGSGEGWGSVARLLVLAAGRTMECGFFWIYSYASFA